MTGLRKALAIVAVTAGMAAVSGVGTAHAKGTPDPLDPGSVMSSGVSVKPPTPDPK